MMLVALRLVAQENFEFPVRTGSDAGIGLFHPGIEASHPGIGLFHPGFWHLRCEKLVMQGSVRSTQASKLVIQEAVFSIQSFRIVVQGQGLVPPRSQYYAPDRFVHLGIFARKGSRSGPATHVVGRLLYLQVVQGRCCGITCRCFRQFPIANTCSYTFD